MAAAGRWLVFAASLVSNSVSAAPPARYDGPARKPGGMPVVLAVMPPGACTGAVSAGPGSMAVALNALPARRVNALAAAMARLADRLDRRRNPFYVEVGDPEEQAEVERMLDEIGPMLSAAAALTAGRWRSGEGDVCLHPVAVCPGATPCHVLDDGDGALSPAAARARFLAWPLGNAILLRAPSEPAAAALAEELRAATPSTSKVALALSGRDLHSLRRTPEVTVLLRQAARLANLCRGRNPRLGGKLDDLAAAARTPDPVPWLRLPRGSLLVVPRLGALATIDRFVDEVRTAVQASGTEIEWCYVPAATGG